MRSGNAKSAGRNSGRRRNAVGSVRGIAEKKIEKGESIVSKGIEYLRRKLQQKQGRAVLRYRFYEAKNYVPVLDPTMPADIKGMASAMGWCGASVDNLADRLVFRDFRDDDIGANEIFTSNNADVLFDSAILGALITSCDFAYIFDDGNGSGIPAIRIIDGCNATGVMDLTTCLLTEGYAVLEVDQESKNPILEAHFEPGRTTYYRPGQDPEIVENKAGVVLLVPIVHRPDAKREFGRSRISGACMCYQSSALQAIRKSEIAAYFYSYPQRYALGFEADDNFSRWRATMSAMLTMGRDDDGNMPTLGQFPQQSMEPFYDHLKMFAGLFAGETGMTLEDMGFPTVNPTSAESIKAAHDTLRLKAKKAQRSFSTCFRNITYTAVCLRDQLRYSRRLIAGLKPIWEPIFEPDSAQFGALGDAIFKINSASEGYIGRTTIHDLTGIPPEGGEQDGTDGHSSGALERYIDDI